MARETKKSTSLKIFKQNESKRIADKQLLQASNVQFVIPVYQRNYDWTNA